MPTVCVFTRDNALASDVLKSAQLAQELDLPLVTAEAAKSFQLQLLIENAQLALCRDAAHDRRPVHVDWTSNKAQHRISQVSRRTEPLSRALGLKANHRPTVVDATAGLGGDSIIMNALGCPVIAIERDPIVAALLHSEIELSGRTTIQLLNLDSAQWLAEQAENSHEIVFLDPMFGKGETRAQVKKPMQLMQLLLAEQTESADLLSDAIRVASKRVVIKRAAKAPRLHDTKPQLTVMGKAIRFDIYLCN